MKKIFTTNLCYYRWIISAVLTACAFGLSAQTYYRVHTDEFATIMKNLDFGDYFIFAIGAPENGIVLKSGTLTSQKYIDGVDVNVSDDIETIVAKGDDKIGFNIMPAENESSKTEVSQIKFNIIDLTGLYLCADSNQKFVYDLDPSDSFNLIFDPNDDGCLQIKSCLKNSNLSIEPVANSKGAFEFRLQTTGYNRLSLYRLDFYDWTIDDSKVTDSGLITLSSTPNDALRTVANPTYIHYILNDGENVSMTELINSTNQIAIPGFKKGESISLSIPTNDILSRANNDNNTLWALPVNHDDSHILIPMGKIITKKYADDGISTGIVSVGVDAYAQESVYYTLDGRKAVMPLVPGVYVRRIGDKADKVIIR